ncbi:hypothetical protein F8388_011340 [Cannabis sativa]|uniref:Myb/SANT-like domain-containing protein n=1 Tax=Cannabis sativa TaxID=3483 RepID=A0A7J6EVQ1_CANSA|nr:hypothetical protein F8388_011340 [Cannabis sativa]
MARLTVSERQILRKKKIMTLYIMETSKGRGPGQNKRFWSEDEDKHLIESLMELNNEGKFKAEGNFKPGHLRAIEMKLKERMPGCDIQAKPHIESRMKTLKTHFQIVHEMLTGPFCSGFGWDSIRKTVTAEKPVWEAYLQSHKEAAPFKIKSFPWYDDLCAMQQEVLNLTLNQMGLQRKRKAANHEELSNALTQSASILAEVIEKASIRLSKAIGEDLNEKHMQLGKELERTTTLTTTQRHKVARMIMQDNALVSYFFSVPDDEKDEWARLLIDGSL